MATIAHDERTTGISVNTVAGAVDAGHLGITYMHEHVFCVNPEIQYYWPGYRDWDEDTQVARAQRALWHLHHEYGVGTILDPTVGGLGRNIRAVARAAQDTGINVIACTGWYCMGELPFTFYTLEHDEKIAELTGLFVRDIRQGLEGTAIKPGAIKCSTDVQGITSDIDVLLRASARAHVETGAPITTHSEFSNRSGLMQQEIFLEEGVDMNAVVIGHVNQSDDLGYMERLVENGSYIGFDRCGLESAVASHETQIDNLAELCRRGYASRVVLAHDHSIFVDLMSQEALEDLHSVHYPYGHVHKATIPGLRSRGVTDDQIQLMLVENPRAFFSRVIA
jgi:phosphotriesterase-related protein